MKLRAYTYLIIVFCLSFSCKEKVVEENTVVIGELGVDLNANEPHIRTQEALIGNFICDGLKEQLSSKNIQVDLVMINAGSIRFDVEKRPSGIYPKGDFSSEMIDEMLPFTENCMVKVAVTGLQLKEMLERSLAQLPIDKGAFMQFSKELRITADLTKQAQVVDETVSPAVIVTPGQRLLSVSINDVPVVDTQVYYIGISDFIANGNDAYVTCLNIPSDKKILSGLLINNLVRDHVTINSPIKPVLDGRISF